MIETTDVTDRADGAGWRAPTGWRVLAWTERDDFITDPSEEGDVYGEPAIVDAWRRDLWEFVVVVVTVVDDHGREWGRDTLGGVESGAFPVLVGSEHAVRELNPITDADGPLVEMLGEALREARAAVAKFAGSAPVITGPDVEH